MAEEPSGTTPAEGSRVPPSDTIEWGESHSGAVKRSDAEKSLK